MALRDVAERGEVTDGVNGAVKPLQKGAARPTMIEKYFMVEIELRLVAMNLGLTQ